MGGFHICLRCVIMEVLYMFIFIIKFLIGYVTNSPAMGHNTRERNNGHTGFSPIAMKVLKLNRGKHQQAVTVRIHHFDGPTFISAKINMGLPPFINGDVRIPD